MTPQHLSSSNPQKKPRVGARVISHLLTAIAAAGALAAAMVSGERIVVALVLAIVLGVTCWGWPSLVGLPNRDVGRMGMAVIGYVALAFALYGSVLYVTYVAALGVPVVYVGEMLRRDGRPRLLTQVAGTYAGGLVGIGGSLWLLVVELPGGDKLALSWMVAMAFAAVATTFVRGPLIGVAVPLAAVAASSAVLLTVTDLAWWPAPAFAVILGVLAWGLEQMTPAVLASSDLVSRVSFALIPFSAMGVVGYALALLVL